MAKPIALPGKSRLTLPHPYVSIVMPVFNAAAYLEESVSSILHQSFDNFEFIIVNDGSSDGTAEMLRRLAKNDPRIRVYDDERKGMIPALNRGCRLARGRYIARMDADDVSFPQRIERQVEYMEQHPQIGIVGSWVAIDKYGSPAGIWRLPTSPNLLKWTLFFGVCAAHPSVLIRRGVMERLDFYRPGALHAEDVDLWFRASSITEFGNVPEVLLKYRVWDGSTSHVLLKVRRETHIKLLASFIQEYLKIEPPIEAVKGLRQLRVGPAFNNPRQIYLTAALLRKLSWKFVEENPVDAREISWDVARKLASLALRAARLDPFGSLRLLTQAVSADYRLLHPSSIVRGLERLLEQRKREPHNA